MIYELTIEFHNGDWEYTRQDCVDFHDAAIALIEFAACRGRGISIMRVKSRRELEIDRLHHTPLSMLTHKQVDRLNLLNNMTDEQYDAISS